jgi:gas vesicle protein
MEKEECSMTDNRGCSLGAVGLAFVTGGLLGAAAALLLAPQSGRQSQEQLRGYARRAEKSAHELADKATEVVDRALDKGREFIQEKASVMTEAVEAGRSAMHAAMQKGRDQLSGEKKA